MKVFVSWSGEHAKQVATAMRDWIPCVIQSTEVFVSAHDIGAGERWLTKINSALDQIDFGIVILTSENKDRPWINFEAGALAKHLDRSRVVPLLCDMQLIELSGSPLNQFQCVSLEKEGIQNILSAIFDGVDDGDPITEAVFSRSFETWWPELDGQLTEIAEANKKQSKKTKEDDGDRLANIEKALSDVIGLIQNQRVTTPTAPVSRNARTVSPVEFFAMTEDEAMRVGIAAQVLARRARTREEIERSIRYIKAHKNANLQSQHLPTLEQRLATLG